MIQIALCDDSHADLRQIAEFTRSYIRSHPEHAYTMQAYASPYELLSQVDGGRRFQIYLLDILMPALSGIEVGRKVRERDDACAIIFCTISPEFALESYEVRAQNYLVKPCRREHVFRSLDQAMARLERQQSSGICVRTAEGRAFLPFHQIVYIELAERRLVFHLADGRALRSTLLRGSLEAALADLLAESRFLQPHKSFVVNMDCVLLWGQRHLLLRGGVEVPVALRRRSAVREEMFSYLSKQKIGTAASQSRSLFRL